MAHLDMSWPIPEDVQVVRRTERGIALRVDNHDSILVPQLRGTLYLLIEYWRTFLLLVQPGVEMGLGLARLRRGLRIMGR